MTGFRKPRLWLSAVGAVVALAALLLGFAKQAPNSRADAGQESSEPVFSQSKLIIEVGLHIVNIHQFSMKDKVYFVEGWYWLRWPKAIQAIITSEKLELKQIVELKNLVETASPDLELDSSAPLALDRNGRELEPVDKKDAVNSQLFKVSGRFYEKDAISHIFQLFKFSGRFYVDNLNLRRSPFETFELPIIVETRPDPLKCNKQEPAKCVYLRPYPKNGQSLVGEFAEINGFKLRGSSIEASTHQYDTNFGMGAPSAFGRVAYNIRYQTDFWAAFIQHVLPVLIILAFVLVSPSLPKSLGDVRLAIPATALLTLIFMQQTYRAEIPSLSYLTFMDWLYAFAFIVSMSLFILFVWGTYRYTVSSEADQRATLIRISRIDTSFQRAAIAGLGVTVLLAWVFTSDWLA
jgi:hypothetical protein